MSIWHDPASEALQARVSTLEYELKWLRRAFWAYAIATCVLSTIVAVIR